MRCRCMCARVRTRARAPAFVCTFYGRVAGYRSHNRDCPRACPRRPAGNQDVGRVCGLRPSRRPRVGCPVSAVSAVAPPPPPQPPVAENAEPTKARQPCTAHWPFGNLKEAGCLSNPRSATRSCRRRRRRLGLVVICGGGGGAPRLPGRACAVRVSSARTHELVGGKQRTFVREGALAVGWGEVVGRGPSCARSR
jgi:hypothetical protein